MIRYRYTIEGPTDDPDGDPYKFLKDVFSREEARQECPIGSANYAHVCEEEKHSAHDDLGIYGWWEVLQSGTLEEEELHSNEPITNFMRRP